MSWREELARIETELDRAVPAPTRVALLERAIDLSDANASRDDGWFFRLELMSAIYHTGDWDKLLLHFGWCIAAHDADPERFPDYDLLWKYKWVINEAARMPQIARARLVALVDDMERRFRGAGSTLRAVHEHRAIVMARIGERDATREAIALWEVASRDDLSDCRACDPDTLADTLHLIGETEGAVEVARALLASRMTCAEIPHRVHARLLASLVARGEHDAAADHHARGYALCRRSDKLVEAHGHHLAHAGRVALDDDVFAMFERHVAGALRYPAVWDRMVFLACARLAFGAVARRRQRHLRHGLPMRLPDEVRIDDRDAPTARALAAWADAEATALATAFDRRNGNDAVSRWVAAIV